MVGNLLRRGYSRRYLHISGRGVSFKIIEWARGVGHAVAVHSAEYFELGVKVKFESGGDLGAGHAMRFEPVDGGCARRPGPECLASKPGHRRRKSPPAATRTQANAREAEISQGTASAAGNSDRRPGPGRSESPSTRNRKTRRLPGWAGCRERRRSDEAARATGGNRRRIRWLRARR